ncbi:MAG: hypothetical protein ABIJ45_12305 [Candidatus Zixiibacteriota bacterium]
MRKTAFYIIAVLGAIVFLNYGCNSNLSPNESIGLYSMFGGYVKNLDNDTNIVAVTTLRNGEPYSTVDFTVFNTLLVYDNSDSVYSATVDSASLGTYYIYASDTATGLEDSVLFSVPQNIAAPTTSLPDGNENPGGATVQIQWLASNGADGYAVAVVLADSLYTDYGFAEFVPAINTIYTIPLEAFRPSGGLDPDTGWYNVYVYSYTGSPRTDLNLPYALPAGLDVNFNRTHLIGSFGSVVVSPKTAIHAVLSK